MGTRRRRAVHLRHRRRDRRRDRLVGARGPADPALGPPRGDALPRLRNGALVLRPDRHDVVPGPRPCRRPGPARGGHRPPRRSAIGCRRGRPAGARIRRRPIPGAPGPAGAGWRLRSAIFGRASTAANSSPGCCSAWPAPPASRSCSLRRSSCSWAAAGRGCGGASRPASGRPFRSARCSSTTSPRPGTSSIPATSSSTSRRRASTRRSATTSRGRSRTPATSPRISGSCCSARRPSSRRSTRRVSVAGAPCAPIRR